MIKYKTLTTKHVKKSNRNSIYKFIYSSASDVSNLDISQSLHLSLPTVSSNVNDLLQENLIVDVGAFNSTGGRKARAFSVNNNARYSIGLNISINVLEIVIINLRGEIITSNKYDFPFRKMNSYYQGAWALTKAMLEDKQIDFRRILGVAISAPIIVSADHSRSTYSALLLNEELSSYDFEKYFPFECKLFNDSNSGFFAEVWNRTMLDTMPDTKNIAFLSVNDSIGGSFYSNNKIQSGENQRAGEFGHITLVPEGRLCYCGQKGCVDPYLSLKQLSQYTDGNLDLFFNKLALKEPEIVKAWNDYRYYLVLTINTLRMIFDCDIIIGGNLSTYLEPYLRGIRELLSRKNTFEKNGDYVFLSRYKKFSTVVGAALRLVDKFINSI